ncbi:MAG: hypothetical protein CMP83_01530 [Gammaproteobacteria bacterium]|nr:hypothetical protein [Gammaproteobacteria bacterium]
MQEAKRFTPTYTSWIHARSRCRNPKNDAYANYGGRGITFAEEWDSYDQFFADMGERPAGTTLDRIDNTKGYEPGNCRWATRQQQSRNRRGIPLIEFNGKRQCIAAWAEDTGLSPQRISARLKRGWSVKRTLTTPPYNR